MVPDGEVQPDPNAFALADAMFDRRPLYAVLFSTTQDPDSQYSPIVAADQPEHNPTVTVPHGFDRETAAALPGLWYCMHLPNDFAQLIEVSAATIKNSQALHLDHCILLAPIQVFDYDHIGHRLISAAPALVVCPDDLLEEAIRRSTALGFPLPPIPYSELSDDSLRAHWRAIHAHFVPTAPYFGHEPTLTRRLDLAPTNLPRRWLARQMQGEDASRVVIDSDDVDSLINKAFWEQNILAATSRLEREGATPESADQRIPRVIEEERDRLRVPVTLALPGVASAYSRLAYDRSVRERIQPLTAVDETDTWSVELNQRSDALTERAAIELVAAHQAVARGGIGLMLPSVPQKAFTVLAELEQHFKVGARGPTVWRMLDQLHTAAQPLWSDALVASVAHASILAVFSNFPIGLLRVPGDTAPLLNRVPITYRPLLPLTRAVQTELSCPPAIQLTKPLRALVAECISADDPVGRLSRTGWKASEKMLREAGQPITLDFVETLSVDALRASIAEKQPEFLVISAHGAFDRRGNVAGLMIGNEFCLGPGLGPLPPVVILSACHVAPRGAGAVTVADLLLREGAVAVLGTQVPVDVAHNAILMGRLFVYVTEVMAQREEHATLLEVWHRVQTSNAINDILNGSNSLHSWGRSMAASGRPVLVEFMSVRSTGQLQMGHIYKDTERVLGAIADDQGEGERVRNWFRSPGYVPESLFYLFIGRPEHIYLRPRVPGPSTDV